MLAYRFLEKIPNILSIFITISNHNTKIQFLIIPIKVKWLGFANAALLFGLVILSGAPVLFGIIAFFGLIPYLLVFGPRFFQSVKAARRRSQFLADTNAASSGAFHVCVACEATDETHPDREFRVTADGEEYCEECLEKAKSS